MTTFLVETGEVETVVDSLVVGPGTTGTAVGVATCRELFLDERLERALTEASSTSAVLVLPTVVLLAVTLIIRTGDGEDCDAGNEFMLG